MNIPRFSRRQFLERATLLAAAAELGGAAAATAADPKPMPAQTRDHYLCITCGSQFAATDGPPEKCPICLDERQYVGAGGQQWTTLGEMQRRQMKNVLREQEANLVAIVTEPKFGIGQRAFLLRHPAGNILWDCISLLDEETIRAIRALGGLSAIAISHPHYYSSMVEWSRAFGDVPIHLHEADRQWVQRPDPTIQFWSGETKTLGEGLTLIRSRGHFDGYQVLHWRGGAESRGILLAGDQPQVCADPQWVSFMWSYPNFIPLSAPEVRHIVDVLEPYPFERLYGAFGHSAVRADAKAIVRRSAERYIRRMAAPPA